MPEVNTLSDREREILQLVATGLTNREIAQSLTISPNTVKVHLSNIFEKINVSSRTEATMYGIEHGIVDVPGSEGNLTQAGSLNMVQKLPWGYMAIVLAVVLLVAVGGNLLFPPATPTPNALQGVPDRWQELAPMPEPKAGMAAAAYDGNIYAIAGEGMEGVSGSVFRYITPDDRWEQLREKPTPVTDVEGVLIGEKIYVPGGKLVDGGVTDILEIYDPRADTWQAGARLPQALSAYAMADFEGRLYLFGGWDGEQALDTVYIYDPDADTWDEGTAMPTARWGAGAAALADKVVVVGGVNEGGALQEAGAYFPSRDRSGEMPWERFENLPEPRYEFGMASVYDSIYLIGGEFENESPEASSGLVIGEEGWVDLPTNQDFIGRSIEMVSLGGQLVMIDSSITDGENQVRRYQAFYYSIYIPIVQ